MVCGVAVQCFLLMIRLPPEFTQGRSSAASDVYKRQILEGDDLAVHGAVHAFHFHDAVGGGDDHAALFAGGGGLVVLDAGLEGGQRGFVGHHLVELAGACRTRRTGVRETGGTAGND